MKTKLIILTLLATVVYGQVKGVDSKHYSIENTYDRYLNVNFDNTAKKSEIISLLDETVGVEYCINWESHRYSVEVYVGKMFNKQQTIWNINGKLKKYFKEKQ